MDGFNTSNFCKNHTLFKSSINVPTPYTFYFFYSGVNICTKVYRANQSFNIHSHYLADLIDLAFWKYIWFLEKAMKKKRVCQLYQEWYAHLRFSHDCDIIIIAISPPLHVLNSKCVCNIKCCDINLALPLIPKVVYIDHDLLL